MRFSWARMAFVMALSALVVAPMASAFAQQASQGRVDVKLKDADMLTATRALTQRTGIQFVVAPGSKFATITLEVSNVTAEDAIRYICEAAGASFRRDENGVYIISDKPATPEVTPVTPTPPDPKVVRKIKILKNKATDVYRRMIERVPFESANPFETLKKFVNLSIDDRKEIVSRFTPQLVNGGAQNYPAQAATTTNVPLTAPENGNQITIPGEGAPQIGGGGFGGGGGGQGIGGGPGGGIGGGGQGGQGGGGQLIGGQGLVPDGIDSVSYNPTDNSLIVYGTEDAIAELQTRINQFDVAPRQIEVLVEFITTTHTLAKDFGAEFLYQRGTINAGTTPGTFVNTSDPVFLNYGIGNIAARLRTFLTEGRGKVENSPRLRTLNNEPASVTSAVQTYIFINQTVATGSVILNEEQPIALTAATTLAVNPRINDDGTITMFLAPQIQNFVGSSVSPSGQEYPNLVFQSIQVVARVRNKETIVLGGLTSRSESETVNKVPVLADLPIIGQFFRHTNSNRTNDELLIFVTPTILDDDNSNPIGP